MHTQSRFSWRLTASTAALVAILWAPASHAHTSSVGYENAGPGSVTFWYGTYHAGTSFTEGSLQVTGPNSYLATVPFSLLTSTKPTGLVDGTTNFFSDGTQLVGTYGGTIYAWQGSTFDNLTAGTYTFTYIPIATPTAVWDPIDAIILSSTVTLDATIIGSPPEPEPEPAPLFTDSATAKSYGAAQVLDSLNGNSSGGMSVAIAVLSSLSPGDQAAALQRITPQTSQASGYVAARTVTGAMDTVQLRMDGIRTQGFRTAWAQDLKRGKVMVASVGDLANLFEPETKHRGVWAKAFGSRSDQDFADGYAGYSADTRGAAFGADTLLESQWVVGGAVSYADTDLDLENFRAGDGSEIKTYQVTGYGTRDFGNWYFESMLAYARHDYDSVRNTGIAGAATADFDGDHIAARVAIGLPIAIGDAVTVTPIAGIEASYLKLDSYSEQGGGALSMRVDGQSSNRLRSAFGAKLATAMELRNGAKMMPSVHAIWRHDFKNDGVDTTATFTGGGATFTTPGQKIESNTYNLGGAVTYQKNETFSFSVQVDGEWASGYSASAAQLVGHWRF